MDKFTVTFAKAFAIALAIMIGSLVIGCKSATEPENLQSYDSEAAADMQASAIGTDAGGAGVSFNDAMGLAKNGYMPGVMLDAKSNTPMSRDSSYDPVSKEHTLTINRSGSKNNFEFEATIVYKYTFYDASGAAMDSRKEGVTDKIVINVTKTRSASKGERLDATDAATGSWIITNIISGAPILNGDYNRDGSITFHTEKNGDRTMTFLLNMHFDNDKIVKDADGYTRLEGPATSHFEATTPKTTFVRDTKIQFNGDGTATLEITRTSGDGSVDTITIDVKKGIFKKWGK